MNPQKTATLTVQGTNIAVTTVHDEDYICLSDMARGHGDASLVDHWLRNKNTIEFLGMWEHLNNLDFNYPEFEVIRNKAGLNRFTISVKRWAKTTGAVGLVAKTGRYGGTYAHRDLAFEFGAWLSPEFKLLLIKEFQRLKEQEHDQIAWNYHRFLSKVNYHLQTDAVKNYILPQKNYLKDMEWLAYADEADLLNVCIFGCRAKDWREANPELAKKGENIRDFASISELTVLANLESLNSTYIAEGIIKEGRFQKLQEHAKRQIKILIQHSSLQLPPQ